MQKIKKDIKENVMDKIKKEEIVMKPKIYFIIGSIIMLIGLIASVISSVFLISIISFLLRSHGPMGEYRLNLMIESFPWYLPILAFAGIVLGIVILRKYDFSYKRNLWFMIVGFLFAVIVGGILVDILGLNNLWFKRGPMNPLMKNYLQENNLMQNRGFKNGNGGQGRYYRYSDWK